MSSALLTAVCHQCLRSNAFWPNGKRGSTRQTASKTIQDFLERHPELLPGLYDLHNGPLHGVIVSKFPFGADYKCDFAFVTRHSMALQFTFVEMKDPKIAVFNKDGSFTKAFNRARLQIADWQIWVEKNLDTLMNMFSPMFDTYNAWNDRKDFRFYLIVAGEMRWTKGKMERPLC